jgi:hypothetical protein
MGAVNLNGSNGHGVCVLISGWDETDFCFRAEGFKGREWVDLPRDKFQQTLPAIMLCLPSSRN